LPRSSEGRLSRRGALGEAAASSRFFNSFALTSRLAQSHRLTAQSINIIKEYHEPY
jgi:hypothetical protein